MGFNILALMLLLVSIVFMICFLHKKRRKESVGWYDKIAVILFGISNCLAETGYIEASDYEVINNQMIPCTNTAVKALYRTNLMISIVFGSFILLYWIVNKVIMWIKKERILK